MTEETGLTLHVGHARVVLKPDKVLLRAPRGGVTLTHAEFERWVGWAIEGWVRGEQAPAIEVTTDRSERWTYLRGVCLGAMTASAILAAAVLLLGALR